MFLSNANSSLARRVGAAALVAAGLAATTGSGYAAADRSDDAVVTENRGVITAQRVLMFTGVEDEVIFDDVVVGDRVRVMQFADGNGEHRVIRVRGDGHGDNGDRWTSAGCIHEDGEGEPVMLEFKEETGDDENKSVYHTVICLTGEDAKPENRAAALEKAIADMEKRAKEDEARRKKMIRSLRKQAKELEKKE